MNIYGYSERGMINSIMYSTTPDQMSRFISLLTGDILVPDDYNSIEILIEQSLSDFGDADLIIMYTASNKRTVLFIEAKVKTLETKNWNIDSEYRKFNDEKYKYKGSNIFRQLLLKKALVDNRKCVQSGVKITDPRVYGQRNIKKIGNNRIVQKAVEKIIKSDRFMYIGLIPDTQNNIASLHLDENESFIHFKSWEDILIFAKKEDLKNPLLNFDYNSGQIF